ncbi:MAG: pyruvate kinase [Desulfobacterota bacterium]|nr:pyruvate kinase [Thermodesulfobacteriota bacterium]MDW8001980.1 pyruvate kinase [Deltaproteobacteria bacterium]
MRRTKIIATLGPSSEDPEKIKELIETGVNVFRLNFSHGDQNYHRILFQRVRSVAQTLKLPVGILQDLSGPKIRVCEVKRPFMVHKGETVEIIKKEVIGEKRDGIAIISIDRPQILEDLKEGDTVCLADGQIKLTVISNLFDRVLTQVVQGGTISSRKGVNFPGVRLSIPAFTEKDRDDLIFGLRMGVDFVALSFVNNKNDVMECRKVIEEFGSGQPIFSKIETENALKEIDSILEVSDGILIARGDLGVEIPLERVPIEQKRLVEKARAKNKIVVVATQMLNSMVHSSAPTRADISDIANAVLDGADALMLSDETAVGEFPTESVRMMAKTIKEAEKVYPYFQQIFDEESPDYAIAKSSCILAKEIKASAIVVFTKSGSSAFRVAKFRPRTPIVANVHDPEILNRLTVIWGVKPYMVLSGIDDPSRMVEEFLSQAHKDSFIKGEETIVLTMGYPVGKVGSTSLIRVLRPDQIRETLQRKIEFSA